MARFGRFRKHISALRESNKSRPPPQFSIYVMHYSSARSKLKIMSSKRKLSLRYILKKLRRISKKPSTWRLISRTTKSPIFSTISFALILCFIYANSLMGTISVKIAEYRTSSDLLLSGAVSTAAAYYQPGSLQVPATTSGGGTQIPNDDPLVPPYKSSIVERIEWFRRKLPELDILNSNGASKWFHGRVLEFFNNNCTAQLYMVWLSAAKTFGPREFLAVDTLFSTSPGCCLLILSNSLDSPEGYRILKPILDRGFNVLAISPDVQFLVKNTPAEVWLKELKGGNTDPGSIPLSNNLSNLIRLAVLYKYGGAYLDTDFIFLKDISSLRNAIGAQSILSSNNRWTRLNGAVMIFDIYHPILLEFLQEFATTFNGNKWGNNGPYLVSRVMERLREDIARNKNITILPPKAFYPVDWIKIAKLFKQPETDDARRWAADTAYGLSRSSYAVHLWNKRSRQLKIEQGSIMAKLIADHCTLCENTYDP